MSLIDDAVEIIEIEKRDPPPDKKWFLVQIKRFEKAADKFSYIASDNPSGSSYSNVKKGDATLFSFFVGKNWK